MFSSNRFWGCPSFVSFFLFLLIFIFVGCNGKGVEEEFTIAVEPLHGHQGEDVTLIVNGEGTDFISFPPRISIVEGSYGLFLGPVAVDNPVRARAKLAIAATAIPAQRHILQVVVKERSFRFDFHVLGTPQTRDAYFLPRGREQGFEGFVELRGENTNFKAGKTQIIFPEEVRINVDEVRVHSSISADVKMRIAPDSPPGTYMTAISTEGETVGARFTIYPLLFPILHVQPDRIGQGDEVSLDLTVENMEIAPQDVELKFPHNRGIAVAEVTRLSETTARALVMVAENAVTGWTPLVLESGGIEAVAQLLVLPSSSVPPSIRLYPTVLSRGANDVELQILGFGTHFQQGVTTLDFVPPEGIRAGEVIVISPETQKAVAIVGVDVDAPLGARDVIVRTGEETARGSIRISEASLITINAVPSVLTQGEEDFSITLDAAGISFLDGAATIRFPPASGIVAQGNLTIEPSGNRATVTVDVAPDAPTGPMLALVRIGGREVEVPLAVNPAPGGTYFAVVPSFVAVPSYGITLSLRGYGTRWNDAGSGVAFGEKSIEVNDFVLIDDTQATVAISIPSWVETRRCLIYVYSPRDILAAWLSLIKPPQRMLSISSPSGESIKTGYARQPVFVRGVDTGMVNAVTRAEFHYGSTWTAEGIGEGIRVDGLNVIDADTAQMLLSVFSTSVPGDYALLLVTGAEQGFATMRVEEGDFSPEIRFDPEVLTAGEVGIVGISGSDTGFLTGITRVRMASPLISDVTIPESSVLIRSSNSAVATVISAPSAADRSVPVVAETDVVIAGRSLSLRRSTSSSYLVSSRWSLRKGEETWVEMEGRGGIDFAMHPPVVDVSPASGIAVHQTDFDATHLRFLVEIGNDFEGDLAWFTIGSEEDAYQWQAAFYVFPVADKARVENPSSPFRAGSQGVTASISLSGMALTEGVTPTVISVDGKAFVESAQTTGISNLEAVFDFAVSAEDSSSAAYVTAMGMNDGALLIPLSITGIDVQTPVVGSTITGEVPPDSPRYYDFFPGDLPRLLVSLSPLLAGEELWYELIGKSSATAGIARIANRGTIDLLLDEVLGWSYGYIIAIGGGEDSGEEYRLSLSLPWSRSIPIEDLEPNDTAATSQGIFVGRIATGRMDNAMDVDYFQSELLPWGICGEIVSTRMSPSYFAYPYVTLTQRDSSDGIVATMKGNHAGDGLDPVVCSPSGESQYYFTVSASAGTTGPYLLFLRPAVIVNEFALESGRESFVELHCAADDRCPGWTLELVSVPTGTLLESITIDFFPENGYWLLCRSDGADNCDLETLEYPIALRACNPSASVCDAVQIGGSPAFGEGEPLDERIPAWRRLWHIDLNNNATDFVIDLSPTPGY